MRRKYLFFILISNIIVSTTSRAWGQEISASEIAFACEDNNGTPITVARNQEGQAETLFHWKEEVLVDKTRFTNQEICNNISEKLNNYGKNYSTKVDDLYSFDLHATEDYGLPIICMSINSECTLPLFALAPSHDGFSATKKAIEVLESSLNPDIIIEQRDPCQNRDCPSSMLYTINLFQLE